MNLIEKINWVNDLLEDDLSKKLFEDRIRFSWVIEESRQDLAYDDSLDAFDSSRIMEIENRFSHDERFLVAGAGRAGKRLARQLQHAGYVVSGFLDNNRQLWGKTINDLKVYSFEWLIENEGYVVVIANLGYGLELYRQIKAFGYPENKIIFCIDGALFSEFGNIYFDLPVHEKGKKEVFIDAGSLNGADCKRFIDWCAGEYEKVIAIEPSRRSAEITKKNLRDFNADVLNLALGDHEGEMDFFDLYDHPGGSGFHESKNSMCYKVPVRRVDDIALEQPVSFIKMDVEGSEISALKGSVNTIKRDRPVLAISVYHNEEDVVEIPLLIYSIREDYKYYLRHYSNSLCDLVLYCV